MTDERINEQNQTLKIQSHRAISDSTMILKQDIVNNASPQTSKLGASKKSVLFDIQKSQRENRNRRYNQEGGHQLSQLGTLPAGIHGCNNGMIMADGTDVYGAYNPLAASANSQMLERTRADREGCSFEEVKRAQSSLVIERLNTQIGALISNSQNITNFHEDNKENHSDGRSSIGSISSADEHDMELLFSGNHTFQFQAVQFIRMKAQEAQAREQALDKQKRKQRSLIQKLKNLFGCNKAQVASEKQQIFKGFKSALQNIGNQQALEALNRKRDASGLGRSQTFQRRGTLNGNMDDILNASPNPVKVYANQSSSEKKEGEGRTSLWKKVETPSKAQIQQKNRNSQSSSNKDKKSHDDDDGACIVDEMKKDLSDLDGKGNRSRINSHPHDDDNDDEKNNSIDQNIDEQHESEINFDNDNQAEGCRQRFSKNYMIPPGSRKLKYFHLIVSLTLYVDFFMTSFILGNYRFHKGEDPDFVNHKNIYVVVFSIQCTDILLTFLKITTIDVRQVNDPVEVAKNYIVGGQFLQDFIAVIPWSVINPQFIFLRYLKLRKFGVYQNYIDQILSEMISSYLNNEQVKKVIDAFRLVVQVTFVSHFFANLWILIGLIQSEKQQKSWILNLQGNGIQLTDFFSLYCTSMYWVITSFSSVGYGDISGSTDYEYIFQMIVEMVGIGFFGWMIGTFQNLIQGFKEKNQSDEQQELIDLWLIQLDKARKQVILSKSIFSGVRDFYSQQFKFDASIVYDKSFGDNNSFFEQLKPRLQRNVLDAIFQNFTITFNNILQDCGTEFQREIFYSAQFKFYSCDSENTDENPDWMKQIVPQAIVESEKESKYVYFILQGRVHLMNKTGMYEYGIIQQGGYFGDISALLNQPNEYSYYYNYYSDKMLIMLAVDEQEFLKICHKHPVAYEALFERAHKRREMFENYKTVTLLKFMKCIKKDPSVVSWLAGQQIQKQSSSEKQKSNEPPRSQKGYQLKMTLIEALIDQYNYNRWIRKREIQNQLENQYQHYTSAFGASMTKTLFCGTYYEASQQKRKLSKKQYQKMRQLEFQQYKEQAMKVDVIIEKKKKDEKMALQKERERQRELKKQGKRPCCDSKAPTKQSVQTADSFKSSGNGDSPTNMMAGLIGNKQPTRQNSNGGNNLSSIQIQGRNSSQNASVLNPSDNNAHPAVNNSQQNAESGGNNSNSKPQYESERGLTFIAGQNVSGEQTNSVNPIGNQGDIEHEGGSDDEKKNILYHPEVLWELSSTKKKEMSFDKMQSKLLGSRVISRRSQSNSGTRKQMRQADEKPDSSNGARSLSKGAKQPNAAHDQFLNLLNTKLFMPNNPSGTKPKKDTEFIIDESFKQNPSTVNKAKNSNQTPVSKALMNPSGSSPFAIEGGSTESNINKQKVLYTKTRNADLKESENLTGTFGSNGHGVIQRETIVQHQFTTTAPGGITKPPLPRQKDYDKNLIEKAAKIAQQEQTVQKDGKLSQKEPVEQMTSPMNLSYAKDMIQADGENLRMQKLANNERQKYQHVEDQSLQKPKTVNSISFRDFAEIKASPVAINVQYNGQQVDDQVVNKRQGAVKVPYQSSNQIAKLKNMDSGRQSEDSFARETIKLPNQRESAGVGHKPNKKVYSVQIGAEIEMNGLTPQKTDSPSLPSFGVENSGQPKQQRLKKTRNKTQFGAGNTSQIIDESDSFQSERDTWRGEINEANYRNNTVDQIKAKLEQNEQKIKVLLREYFSVRESEKMRDIMLNQMLKKSNKTRKPGNDQAESKSADIDNIIEEYLNIKRITEDIQEDLFKTNKKPETVGTSVKKQNMMKMNSIDTTQTQNQEELQNSQFKQTKEQYDTQIMEQVKKFADSFNAKVDQTQEFLDQKILEKLEIVYNKFDQLPDCNKDFLVRKLQEKKRNQRSEKAYRSKTAVL